MLRAVVFLLLLAPSAAFSLSCAKPNFADEFNRIAEAEELYWIGFGELRLTGAVPEREQGQPYTADYEFTGTVNFSRNKVAHDVVLEATCAASWCGGMPEDGVPVIVFLEHKDEKLVLNARPCGGDILVDPTLGQVGALRTCFRNRACGEAERATFD